MPSSPSLCETFRFLAFGTWRLLGSARQIKHQLLEETVTDLLILELKTKHPHEVHSETFTKPREGRNGADWEWWFLDKTGRCFGVRVQAKILNRKSDRFEHLHYQKTPQTPFQADKLISECDKDKLVPLYCFYTDRIATPGKPVFSCQTFSNSPEFFGCSITSAFHVRDLQKTGRNKLNEVLSKVVPWHCLVCCSGYGESTLPDRVRAFLQNALKDVFPKDSFKFPSVLPAPPPHVRQILDNRENETMDPEERSVQGIVVIQETNTED